MTFSKKKRLTEKKIFIVSQKKQEVVYYRATWPTFWAQVQKIKKAEMEKKTLKIKKRKKFPIFWDMGLSSSNIKKNLIFSYILENGKPPKKFFCLRKRKS